MSKITVGHTSLGLFQDCEVAYYWKYIRNLVASGTKPAPLEFGIALHAALEIRGKGGELSEALAKFDELYSTALDFKRTPKAGRLMIKDYYERYENDHLKILGSETSAKVELSNCFYSMRLDDIVEDHGVIKVKDYKSTSDMGQTFIEGAKPNGQFTSYIYGARELYDKSIDTLIIDGLLTPYPYKNKPLETDFMRFETTRTELELQLWKDNVERQVDRILHCTEHGDWIFSDDKFSGCTKWKEVCTYKDLCSIPAKLEDKKPMGDTYYNRKEKK